METTVLMVTWLITAQPPSSYAVEFATPQGCETARRALYADLRKMLAERDRNYAEAAQRGFQVLMRAQPPHLSAICARK